MAKIADTDVQPADRASGSPSNSAADWFCKNCGQVNSAEATECLRCTFARNYDPEAKAQVDYTAVQVRLQGEEELRRHRITFYLELVKNGLLLVLVAVLLSLGVRLMNNWPFEGPFVRDAGTLADKVMLLKSSLEMGTSKAQYDERVLEVRAAADEFRIRYDKSAYSLRSAYQKLYQAAEFYVLAGDVWQKQITADSSMPANPNARSVDANDQAKQLWEKAAANATVALEDLR